MKVQTEFASPAKIQGKDALRKGIGNHLTQNTLDPSEKRKK